MRERISIVQGDATICPFVFVAPHGADDPMTGVLAESLATRMNGFAVINNGFERAKDYDYDNDKCNCNDIEHVLENDVPKSEFLDPLMNFMDQIAASTYSATMIILHGVNNTINNKRSKKDKIEIIAGYGSGNPPSITCAKESRHALLYCLNQGFNVYRGDSGGPFAGRRRKNLNQLYRKWFPRANYNSMQLEIVRELRETEDAAILTSELMAKSLMPFMEYLFLQEFDNSAVPKEFGDDWENIAKNLPRI